MNLPGMRMLRFLLCFGYLLLFSRFAIANSHHPEDFLNNIQGKADEGEQIVQHFCVNCHAAKPIIPLGAPRIGVLNDWQKRVGQGLKLLMEHTDEGYGAMPARGGCFECSDEQLQLAIVAMLPEELKKELLNELGAHKKNT